jgi:hypothetical protein
MSGRPKPCKEEVEKYIMNLKSNLKDVVVADL